VHYRHIADDIARRILDSEFSAEDSLPSEHALAAEYGVARGTVRHALVLLRDRGIVSSRPGAGWTVGSTTQSQDLGSVHSFAQWARARGHEPGGRVLESVITRPTVSETRRLRLGSQEDVLRVLRIRSLDGADIMVERTTYASWMIPVIRSLRLDQVSVVQAITDRFNVSTVSTDTTIDAVAAGGDDAALLGVEPQHPLLRVRRTSADVTGRPIEMGDDRYVHAAMAFHIRQRVGP
jgi:GntR family transcriptional regulator